MTEVNFYGNKLCPHCKIPMSVGDHTYETEDGGIDVEYYYYCDECGADYS